MAELPMAEVATQELSSPDSIWETVSRRAAENLMQKMPQQMQNDLPNSPSNSNKTIQQINEQVEEQLLGILSTNEKERIKQQKPLQISLLVFVGVQLVVFNGIIGYWVFHIFRLAQPDLITGTLDFLKYYIGAVLVELIGMIVFITKSTFTSPTQTIIKGLLGRTQK